MTIVPLKVLRSDPQHLLYHFPSIHPVRYTHLSREYHYWRAVYAAEQTAQMCGRLLVPGRCLHWERKRRYQDRRIAIGKHTYYVMSEGEMTPHELRKYRAELQEAAGQ